MDPPPPGTGIPPPLQGFGSDDMTTPFNYGSVRDGKFKQDSLEHKLKKQYWKTKQTVTQKLGKTQDEFVVAGDTEIDTKLEKAYHLRSSCTQLLQALNKYVSRLKVVSSQESVMGEYLRTWSEIEYTNAGEVMQNVGKLQESINKIRLNMVPALLRMYSEFAVFQTTALRDLNFSIQQMEKARTEYRAALLWMKDVSEKLENPDYRNQLAKFREAQATVKETKERYDRLKHDLSEKIDMVSASRCNLLSRSLPFYQKEVLLFNDNAANEFHKILVDLRSHHHHQYKVRRLAEEIRDLEAEESPFVDEPELLLGKESPATLSSPDGKVADDDEPLLDVSNAESQAEKPAPKPVGDELSLEKVAQEARVNDLTLSGTEAELRHMQDELLQATEISESQTQTTPPKTTTTTVPKEKAELDDLLQLVDKEGDEATLGQAHPHKQQDQLFDEWSNFSAFMPNTRSNPSSPTSGWEKEFMYGAAASGDPLDSVDGNKATPPSLDQTPQTPQPPPEELNQSETTKPEKAGVDELLGISDSAPEAKDENTLLSDDLQSLGLGSPVKTNASRTQATAQQDPLSVESLDSSYFSTQQRVPQLPPGNMLSQPPQPPFRSPLSISSGPIFPPGMPLQSVSPMVGPGARMPPSAAVTPGPVGGDTKADKKGKGDQDKASTSWMNVFAHLDPLVNEKA